MYKNILVPLDGSKLAECIIPHLETIVQGCEAATIWLVRAVEPFHAMSVDYTFDPDDLKRIEENQQSAAEKYLSDFKTQLRLPPICEVKTSVLHGKPAEVIADFISQQAIDLVLIATHGRSGPSKWIWGSVADRILRASCAPVLMIRAPECVVGI